MSQRRIRNWSEYNAGLKQRGSLTFWMEPAVLDNWIEQEKTGKPRATMTYANQAIVTMVSLKSVFRLPGRALCGFVESVFKLMNIELSVPDTRVDIKRLQRLEVNVVVDSIGVKVFGEGEWKTRQHDVSKRRKWRKLHLAVDEVTGEVLSAAVTDNDVPDGKMLGGLLDGVAGPVSQGDGDGAYDQSYCYDFIEALGAIAGIPPLRTPRSGCMATAKRRPTRVTRT